MSTKRLNGYYLTSADGKYIYTGLGKFRTLEAAKDKWNSNPRNGSAGVVAYYDVIRLGVVYGLDTVFVGRI